MDRGSSAIEELSTRATVRRSSPKKSGLHLGERGLALALLVLGAPLFVLVALIVRRSGKGQILYRGVRLGQRKRPFTMYKFRTLKEEANRVTGPELLSHTHDLTIPYGKFLRETRLDELPQLWNVLRGDMSLVGPRPERPTFVREFKHKVPQYMLRHRVKAGITGWAQVHGWRGNTSIDKRIEYDIYYIENWSLALDLKILWMTAFRGFVHSNAY